MGADLQRRFGLPYWQFSLTATDANRCVLRMARMVQKRPARARLLRVLPRLRGRDDRRRRPGRRGAMTKPGNVGPQVDPDADHQGRRVQRRRGAARGARAARRRRRAHGAVDDQHRHRPPRPGFLEIVRELCDETGTLLINDETHTFSAGVGGCTRALGLRPDIVTIGKAHRLRHPHRRLRRHGGARRPHPRRPRRRPRRPGRRRRHAGRQRARHAAAARATLEHVLTEENFAHMIALATRYTEGVQDVLDAYRVPWVIVQLGARAEYRFSPGRAAHRQRVAAPPRRASSTSTCTCTRSTAASS